MKGGVTQETGASVRTVVTRGRHGAQRPVLAGPPRKPAPGTRRPRRGQGALCDVTSPNGRFDASEGSRHGQGGDRNDETGALADIRLYHSARFEELKPFNTVKDWT